MTRKTRQLQWHRPSRQWCKRRDGKVYYLGRGTPARDGQTGRMDEDYDAAVDKWLGIKVELDGDQLSRQRDERIEGLEVQARLAPSMNYRAVVESQIDALETGATVADVDAEAQVLDRVRLLAHRAVTLDHWRLVAQAIESLDAAQPPQDKSVAKMTAQFLAFKLTQTRANQRSPGRYVTLEFYAKWFRDWVGGSTSVDAINTLTVRSYYNHLLEKVGSKSLTAGSAKDALQAAKQLIRWLAENSIISSLPANIASRELIFRMPPGKKTCFTIAEYRNLLDHANDRMKLFLHLMSNCGMTQKDISDLKPEEVDWRGGLIRRKRSKTQQHESVEAVTYRLWPETRALLERLGQRTGERVLLGKNGRPLVYIDIKPDGKAVHVDAVAYAFNRLRRVDGVWVTGKTLTDLRSTSATLLKNSQYYHLVALFLGHAARTTADRYYAAEYDNRLDDALAYLRDQYLVRELPTEEAA